MRAVPLQRITAHPVTSTQTDINNLSRCPRFIDQDGLFANNAQHFGFLIRT